MQTKKFLSDKAVVETLLKAAAKSVEEEGHYFSHWFHGDDPGFGLVIVADRSGEFHLMANCDVVAHVEKFNTSTQQIEVLNTIQRPTAQLHEFELLYASFKQMVTLNG
jgi:hypothetical protein